MAYQQSIAPLKRWIGENAPAISAEWADFSPSDVLAGLNKITGLGLRPEDSIELTMPRVLEALQRAKDEGRI